MRFIRLICLAALVAATACSIRRAGAPSGAQEVPVADWPIVAGSRVKIRSPLLADPYDRYTILGLRHVIGTVVSATPDTLIFRADGDSIATAIIPTRRIFNIEIARVERTPTR